MPISSEDIGELGQARDDQELADSIKAEDEYSGVAKVRRSHAWVIVVVVIVCLVVGGIVGFMLWYFLRKPGGTDAGKDIGASCTSSTDCLPGLQCSSFQCKIPQNGQCSTTTQCSTGLVCTNNRCQ